MGKAKKTKSTKHRLASYKNDEMDVEKVFVSAGKGEIASAEVETSHAMFKRHSAEWKKMKSEVVQLKKAKIKLRNKVISEREEKKRINHKIKDLISNLKNQQIEEEKKIGIDKPQAVEEADKMMLD